jgi:methionyl aminopeptidase
MQIMRGVNVLLMPSRRRAVPSLRATSAFVDTRSRSLNIRSSSSSSISQQATASSNNAAAFDEKYEIPPRQAYPPREPVQPYELSPYKPVPPYISRPPYADTGNIPHNPWGDQVLLHDASSIERMRIAARLARKVLDIACASTAPGNTSDEIDTIVHNAIIEHGAYPSPLNYAGFPKSLCSSINEIICHGIPDARPLLLGDVVSFDVSCFVNGVHGDNCATIIVGDSQETMSDAGADWRGVPYRTQFESHEQELAFLNARRLVHAARESLYAAIATCRPGSCLTEVGAAIQDVADAYGYSSVQQYRGHGVGEVFHCPPFVKVRDTKDVSRLSSCGLVFVSLFPPSHACFVSPSFSIIEIMTS